MKRLLPLSLLLIVGSRSILAQYPIAAVGGMIAQNNADAKKHATVVIDGEGNTIHGCTDNGKPCTIISNGRKFTARDLDTKSYQSATLSVHLEQTAPGRTAIYLIERGDADEALIEAFYYTWNGNVKLLLHKEASTPLVRDTILGTDIMLDLGKIEFFRVKEVKLQHETEFGRKNKP
jgi:hypothetical protein